MNRFLLLALAVLMSLIMVSCYTTFRAPHTADGADEAYDEPVQAISAPLNPTIPQTLAGNYGWLYYYDSAWWMDEYENYENTGRGYAPEGYRQRFPNDPSYDPSVSGGYGGGTVVAPALGKGSADNPDSSASQSSGDRRTFSTGNTTSTQAGVNSTPPPQQDTTPRSSTTTTAPAAKPGGREQVKRK